MTRVGTTASLTAMKLVAGGIYLDGGDLGEVFLPKREAPEGIRPGDSVEVFVYRDSETVLTATTKRPLAQLGQCAVMKVMAVTGSGAFMNWGPPKDLFVPTSEQYKPLEVGKSYVILVYLDEPTGRLAGTTRLHSHLSEDGSGFTPGQEVNLLVCGFSELGYKAVINHTHLGLIFKDDTPADLRYGQSLQGFIKAIRADRKIDLSLLPPGLSGLDMLSQRILDHLNAQGGTSAITDKSPASEIANVFGTSKSVYKKALGRLYKQKIIAITPNAITLLPQGNPGNRAPKS